MKPLVFVMFLAFVHASRGGPQMWVGTPKLIAENEGVRIFAAIRPSHPSQHVLTEVHQVRAALPDGRMIDLETGRTPAGGAAPRAIISPQGHIALIHGRLNVFLAPAYRPAPVLKLRTDRLATSGPGVESFTIGDAVWRDSVIACAGTFKPKGEPGERRDVPGRFPFISRLLVTSEPGLKDHQILWTTWRPGTGMPDHPETVIHQSAEPLYGSLHFQEKELLWRNIGNWGKSPFPVDGPAQFSACSWQLTSLETGKTEALAEQKVNRGELAVRDKELAKSFIFGKSSRGNHPERNAFILEAMFDFKP